MLRKNQKEEMPFAYYLAKYAGLDPAEVTARLGEDVTFDGEAFGLSFLGRPYRLAWPDYAIESPDAAALALRKMPAQTFLLRYLLEGRTTAWKGDWKTFREMPWGEMYIKPYTGRVLTRAAFTFGTRLDAFRAAAEKVGGRPVPHGDAGYEFDLIDGYRMQILVWAGDEEFPPNAQVLYSGNFADGFAAEDRVVAGDILIGVLKSAM